MSNPLDRLKKGVSQALDTAAVIKESYDEQKKREREEKEYALSEEYANLHNLSLQRQAELVLRPNGKVLEIDKEKAYIRCKKCGDYVLVDKHFFVNVLGGATALSGVGAWTTFLFAGTGFAAPICAAILLGGVAMLKYSDQITKWISTKYPCELCGDRDWELVNGDAIISERRKVLEYRTAGERLFGRGRGRGPKLDGVELLHAPFQFVQGDITKLPVDAVVNPGIGSGGDDASYNAPGRQLLLAEGKNVGDIGPGDAVYSDALHMAAQYVIHTVPPRWVDGRHGERETLRACYANSLRLADELYCKSVAFPLINPGNGFPKDEALQIALTEIKKFLADHDMEVILVAFDRKELELAPGLERDIQKFINERLANVSAMERELQEALSRSSGSASQRHYSYSRPKPTGGRSDTDAQRKIPSDAGSRDYYAERQKRSFSPDMAGKLDVIMHQPKQTFQQRLFQLIDDSIWSDVDVYNRANIDRRLFSRIRCNVNYRPKKETAIALAVALELDMTDMLDLMARAGLTLSPSDPFDLVIRYFVTNRIYDIFAIDTVLFKYGLPTLGSDA